MTTPSEFAALHRPGTPVVLPNAWDAASAVLIAAAGAPAVATSSAAVAWALGRPDGEHLTRDEVVAVVARIVAAVDVPVSADIEAGYGDVAATVVAVAGAGAVGVNLEDSQPDGTLYPVEQQAERVAAARAAGGEGFVVNARTDVYLRGIGEPEGRAAEVLRRAEAFAAAGASCLFVPGLLHLPTLTDLVRRSALPISVLAEPAGPSIAELTATGVVRISLGTALAEAAYGQAVAATRELFATGTMKQLQGYAGYGEVDSSFRP
ncbi:isocitrate lyase/phosphoenolpyruvate mutase family protein [Kineosporia sp. J2-2]|uniref:Isocitrate lyase/phosphoenolpyruvate mutase family protein n=1 Tax=Kineosporia corallincola TaxID=2835133 RepID=A0ABS5TSN4_9ACTN|nr:isocitrate lyase/phosphoenolpyruvate mutase family protein [Kineosporia corallincola]MBT0773780.1 isocitrate lyase/phosphoenolpyruvate mutase family protein [Kineosporia corallincola]